MASESKIIDWVLTNPRYSSWYTVPSSFLALNHRVFWSNTTKSSFLHTQDNHLITFHSFEQNVKKSFTATIVNESFQLYSLSGMSTVGKLNVMFLSCQLFMTNFGTTIYDDNFF